ncbi:MAG: hypothetical protein V4629_12130 [Pseudomonadota bacterium]
MKIRTNLKFLNEKILISKTFFITSFSACAVSLFLSSVAQSAEMMGPPDSHIGFSGVQYHIPRGTRPTWYKYQATRNKMRGDGKNLAQDVQNSLNAQGAESLRRNYTVSDGYTGDCAISIGNVSKSPLAGRSDNVVIIDGDVINAGDCN